VLKELGNVSEALLCYQRAIEIDPNFVEALSNLGTVFREASRVNEALVCFQKALTIQPDSAELHSKLGLMLYDLKQYDQAITCCQRALAIDPKYADAHNNMGLCFKATCQLDKAMVSYRQAIACNPDYASAHSNLGNTLRDAGQYNEALTHYHRALLVNPNFAEAHNNLGGTLEALGQFKEAATSYRCALDVNPNYAEAHNNLGNSLKELKQLDSAVNCYRRALEIKPNFAEAFSNLGNALVDLGELESAVTNFRQSLQIKPNFAEAHYNLGNALKEIGRPDAAQASYLMALKIKPDYVKAYSNMLYLHAFTRNISPERECAVATHWEECALSKSELMEARSRTFNYSSRIERKLKIGIVSAELGQHAVAEFLEPILEQLDRNRFHATLFPTTVRNEPRAARINGLANEIQSLVGISDRQAAELIRTHQIDILIDTTSHMGGCRLGIFAHRAAPVQCHYIGYHGTTGLTEMDWFIADEELLPSNYDTHFREKIWRLPRLRLAYKGDASLPESGWKPSEEGVIWLGSFNNLAKVREEALGLWAQVMNAIPQSKLLLKDRLANDTAVQTRIQVELGHHGISAERVRFFGMTPDWHSHMVMYDQLDIALDAIPLNSETTAFDALWMGVPLVALEGNWVGGRMASTILKSFGKPEWVAKSNDEYVTIIAALAKNIEERASLRVTQRALMAEGSLCDAKGLTRALEAAFETMFEKWVEQQIHL
jgi:predicted O-linked N-acetylglucosamine transferase (SPINDLY family)